MNPSHSHVNYVVKVSTLWERSFLINFFKKKWKVEPYKCLFWIHKSNVFWQKIISCPQLCACFFIYCQRLWSYLSKNIMTLVHINWKGKQWALCQFIYMRVGSGITEILTINHDLKTLHFDNYHSFYLPSTLKLNYSLFMHSCKCRDVTLTQQI